MKPTYIELAPSQIPEWYAYQLDAISPVYNISFNHYFFKNMNGELFVKTWQTIINRHEVFRVRFDFLNGKPVQTLTPPIILDPAAVIIDNTHVSEHDLHIQQNAHAKFYGNAPFDFETGPLFRLHLILYKNNESQLIFTVHHIIWDETSTMNLISEFIEIYNALSDNRAPNLPSLPCQYFNYVERVNTQLASGQWQHHEHYWLKQFGTVPPALELPLDFPRPAIQTYNGESIERWLPRTLVREVSQFLPQHNATLFMLLLTLFNIYFYRITGQNDIVLGCPIAGRDDPDLKSLLGCFATPLPIRCQLNREYTFIELLQQIRTTVLDAFEHRKYPCTKLIEKLVHQKDYSRPKLFSIMAGIQNDKTAFLDIPLRECQMYNKDVYRVEAHGARFDLAIGLDPLGSDVKLFCTYNTALFHPKTVNVFLDGITCLLGELLNNPLGKLYQFPLMPKEQYQLVLNKFNPPSQLWPSCQNIHELFEQQVAKTPKAIAVQCGQDTFDFQIVNQRANQLSHYLLKCGVQLGEAIALIFEPSIEMIIALLAVLKTGAGYVPITPSTPNMRKKDTLTLTKARYILTLSPFLDDIGTSEHAVITLDLFKDEIEQCQRENPNLEIPEHALAYVMHSSGTTNRPKTIPILHAGVINLLNSTQAQYHATEKDKILLTTVFTFDASILEIFWPLCFGAQLIIPQLSHFTPSSILKVLADEAITIMQTVPTFLDGLCEELEKNQLILSNIRLIICGGASLTRALRDRCQHQFPGKLVNHYGPTEVTVDATSFNCNETFIGDIVPIGKPIANVTVLILDEHSNPSPIGIPGEIYVASPGLSPGYWNNPFDNEQKFLTKTFQDRTYRLYKTGDLGKFDENGIIYFCGRQDKQIKINGNRVELEEIEQALQRHSLISKAAVQFHTGADSENQLIAFIEKKHTHRFSSRGEIYYQYTLGQRPHLIHKMKHIHLETWPKYFAGSPFIKTYWTRVWHEFPDYQFCLLNEKDEIAAVCNGIPLYWDGAKQNMPSGWDEGIELAFNQVQKGIQPNTLLGLTGVVDSASRNKGISPLIVQAFRTLAKMHGLTRFLGPVRPIGMLAHNCQDFKQWAESVDEKDEPLDHWLRTHKRLGAKVMGLAPYSQLVEGTLDDWEEWTGHRFAQSGAFQLPDTLQPIQVNITQNKASYYDPSIWVMHDELLHDKSERDAYLSIADLKAFLSEILPVYMLPHRYHILPEVTLLESGKINEMVLRAHAVPENRTPLQPQNEIQRFLKEIFQETLGLNSIGIEDDFFLLGGQSLQMLHLLEKILRQYDVKLSIKEFYRNPTIYQLDKHISSKVKEDCVC